MLESGKYNQKAIADIMEISPKTVFNIIKKYEFGRTFVTASEKQSQTCTQIDSIFLSIEEIIFTNVSLDNSITLQELCDIIKKYTNIFISKSIVCRKLKRINISKKKLSIIPNERNFQDKIDARAIYSSELSLISPNNLLFLDKTGVNYYTTRTYDYSTINTKAYITVSANREKNRSLICAISISGIIAWDYKLGEYSEKAYISFISNKLISYFQNHSNSILIADIVRFYKTTNVINLLKANKFFYKFTVPYSSELNPIEEFFSVIKSKFYTIKKVNNDITIEDILSSICNNSINYSEECKKFFNYMISFLEKARQKEPFI